MCLFVCWSEWILKEERRHRKKFWLFSSLALPWVSSRSSKVSTRCVTWSCREVKTMNYCQALSNMSGRPGLLDRPQSLFYFVPQEFHRQAFAKYIFNTISTFSLELAKQVTTKAYQNVKIINKTDLFNILPISDMWIHLNIFSFLGAWWHSGGWKLPDQAGWTGSTTNCQTEIRYMCVLFMSVQIISLR